MVILTRTLHLIDSPQTAIAIRVFVPAPRPIDWGCRAEIDWPDGLWSREIIGIDAIQALQLALQMIGTNIYASDLHKRGRLVWLAPGEGYGFPVASVMRDMLIGEDRKM